MPVLNAGSLSTIPADMPAREMPEGGISESAVIGPSLASGADHSADLRRPPRPLTILVVDDNVDSATTMSLFLEICGYGTRVAHDGLEAVRAADEYRPDVIVMDIGMPGMSGHDAARAIRKQPWAAETLLIALSGWGQEADKQRSRDAGFNHHLVKPVDHAVLTGILNRASTSIDP